MKKLFGLFLAGCLTASGIFAEGGKTAFVYFSATGTTAKMAQKGALSLNADIFEIVPEHKYTDADLNWHDRKSLTTIECNDVKSRPVIKSVVSKNESSVQFDSSKYDNVILCYPIWWGMAPKIMYTFVEGQKLSGKKILTLCTSGGSGLGRSGKDLVNYAKGAEFKGGKDFTYAGGEEIKKYVEGLLK